VVSISIVTRMFLPIPALFLPFCPPLIDVQSFLTYTSNLWWNPACLEDGSKEEYQRHMKKLYWKILIGLLYL